jgi:predicted amidohydrolase
VDAPVKIACVQAEPVILDREATVDKLVGLAAEAAGEGASLLVFPEAFNPRVPVDLGEGARRLRRRTGKGRDWDECADRA